MDDDGDEFVHSDDATRTVGSGGLADRLSEILVEDGDGDLLMQQSNFLQWLQALDFQAMGACRADERLKPLLMVNSSGGVAEDRILSHLSQHFEASEVGLLARCLCVPLVSFRVGKVVKQGTLLCPTSLRGNLNLTLLPSSGLRLSFVGDDGLTQRLATLADAPECSVVVDEILADQSGRSFLVKVPDSETFYFWCSEKSMIYGSDLLSKMKDLLKRKPTLSELTGISESRLERFATNLRAYLVGSSVIKTQAASATSGAPWVDIGLNTWEPGFNTQSRASSARPLRSRHSGGQALKGLTQHQGTLSPRSSSFKDGPPRTLSSLRSASREKLRRRGDTLPPVDTLFTTEAVLNHSEKEKHSESNGCSSLGSPLSFLDSLVKCPSPQQLSTISEFPPVCPLFSPYYCWCPPCTSPDMTPIPQLPTLSVEPFSLPPVSTLLSATSPSTLLTQFPPLDLGDATPLDFPALLSSPLARLPFSTQSPQQIPTFTPLMCDSIVHIPIVDVCSSGQGFLVSTGPAVATNIPPLHPKFVVPMMMPEDESMAEKNARETLRLLIGSPSGHPTSSLMEVFPAVLSNEGSRGIEVRGSRGLFSVTRDIDAIVGSFAAVGLASHSARSIQVSSSSGSSGSFGKASSDLNFEDSMFMSKPEEKDG